MHFLASALLAVAAIVSTVVAQSNPISKPDSNAPLVAGEPTTITWTPNTAGPIMLKWRQGPSSNLIDILVIVSGYANSGTYTWTVPKDTPSGDNYAIQIIDEKTNEVNYTPLLSVRSDVGPKVSTGSPPSTIDYPSTLSTSTKSYKNKPTAKPEPTKGRHGGNSTSTTLPPPPPSIYPNATVTYGSENSTTLAYPTGTAKTAGDSDSTSTSSTSTSKSTSGPSASPSGSAPSSGAASLVMNSPLALAVCVLGAVMYLN